MNTLSKDRTGLIFGEAADTQFAALERHWKNLTNGPERIALRAEHHLLYAALRGKDWRRGFAPITNRRKLDNGGFYGWGAVIALSRIHYSAAAELLAPFEGVIDPGVLQRLRAVLPKGPHDFSTAAYVGEGDDGGR